MGWLFENFQILLVIGLALAAWLKNRAEAKEEEEAERQAREDMVRHLKEVKARKVERAPAPQSWDTRPQAPEAPAEEPPPLRDILRDVIQGAAGFPETLQPQTEVQVEDAYDDSPAPWESFEHQDASHSEIADIDEPQNAVLDRQRKMEERLAELKRQAAESRGQVEGARATQRRLAGGSKRSVQDLPPIAEVLKDRSQTRRAIILNEILSKPLGLRGMS